MTAREVIALARSGELQQLSPFIKDDDNVLVSFINLALIEIYKRFVMRTSEALITLRAGKTIYKLDGTDPDVSMPINEKFMYIISAYGNGRPDSTEVDNTILLPINVEEDPYSINTVSYDSIQIPLITAGAMVSLIYASMPRKVGEIPAGATPKPNYLDEELDLPYPFMEALLHYMGYRGHGAMDGNIQTESNTHYMRFEASCNKIKELGVGITDDDVDMGRRLNNRGFV